MVGPIRFFSRCVYPLMPELSLKLENNVSKSLMRGSTTLYQSKRQDLYKLALANLDKVEETIRWLFSQDKCPSFDVSEVHFLQFHLWESLGFSNKAKECFLIAVRDFIKYYESLNDENFFLELPLEIRERLDFASQLVDDPDAEKYIEIIESLSYYPVEETVMQTEIEAPLLIK